MQKRARSKRVSLHEKKTRLLRARFCIKAKTASEHESEKPFLLL